MRFVLFTLLCAGLSGCGPMLSPMVPRLRAEDQQRVDQMWDNMLTPPARVDRQTLLDVNVTYLLYTLGVDRLHMTSEKYFSGGVVLMQIDCDRANPDSDEFTITVLDQRGRTIRRERYSRADVDESSKMAGAFPFNEAMEDRKTVEGPILIKIESPATTQSATQPSAATGALTSEQQHLRDEMLRRRLAVIAATQPARVAPAHNSP
jgi:hypothetical protein